MFETVKIIIQLIPLILQLVKAVEDSIPEGGKGKDKLAFIHTVLTDACPQIADIWLTVEKIITSTVALYNATGVFKK
jgi:hypothetical protein